MGRIIVIANQKGGVGKTTTAINLSAYIAIKKKRVLLIDMDPQGNASGGFDIDPSSVTKTVYDVMLGEASIEDAIISNVRPKLSIVPSDVNLAAAEIQLSDVADKNHILKKELGKIRDKYDYIIMDCPPSLNILTINAMCAADSVIVPLQCEYYALEGLSQLITTIKTIKKKLNPHIDIEGVLGTMYDGRTNLSIQVLDEVKKYFPDKVYKTIIPRNVRLSESPSFGEPIINYDRTSKGADAYMALAKEVIKNNS